jgi:hypothetical protein
VEVIGEGSMGSVWRAKQSEPVKWYVAAKLIKAGMDSRQVLARFEAGRQAPALMDDPNIAKVLDGGLLDRRPFFVAELVKGVPITEYPLEQAKKGSGTPDPFFRGKNAMPGTHVFETETYRPINITSRSWPPPPGAASRVITIT